MLRAARLRRFSLAVPLAGLLLALPAGAWAQENLRDAAREARRVKEASTRKVWDNDDMVELRKRSVLNVVGMEPAVAPGSEASINWDEMPAGGRYVNMSMEEREARIRGLEEEIAGNQETLQILRDQLFNAQDAAQFDDLSARVRAVEQAIAASQEEIEHIRNTPPPRPQPAGSQPQPRPAAPSPPPSP
jgi:uncharacterized coiled-coil protein SlyX